MTVRTELVQLLLQALPDDLHVEAYARQSTVAQTTVAVRVDAYTPSTLPQSWITCEAALLILSAHTDQAQAEDDLDAVLADVLFALDQSQALTWSRAQRAVVDDTIPAYEVTLAVTAQRS